MENSYSVGEDELLLAAAETTSVGDSVVLLAAAKTLSPSSDDTALSTFDDDEA